MGNETALGQVSRPEWWLTEQRRYYERIVTRVRILTLIFNDIVTRQKTSFKSPLNNDGLLGLTVI